MRGQGAAETCPHCGESPVHRIIATELWRMRNCLADVARESLASRETAARCSDGIQRAFALIPLANRARRSLNRRRAPTIALMETDVSEPALRPSFQSWNRRTLLLGAALGALSVAATTAGFAQQKKAAAADPAVEELMKAGPLPDLALGKADAPVTIVEYASMTCGHCATFPQHRLSRL